MKAKKRVCSKNREAIRNLQSILQPRLILMPEPFYSALIHYFHPDNVKKLFIEDIGNLRRDMLVIALNLNDGNNTQAANMLKVARATVLLHKSKLCI